MAHDGTGCFVKGKWVPGKERDEKADWWKKENPEPPVFTDYDFSSKDFDYGV